MLLLLVSRLWLLWLAYRSGGEFASAAAAAVFSVSTETSGAKPVLERESEDETSESAVLARSRSSELRASSGVRVSRCWSFSNATS